MLLQVTAPHPSNPFVELAQGAHAPTCTLALHKGRQGITLNSLHLPTTNGSHQAAATNRTKMSLGEQSRRPHLKNEQGKQESTCANYDWDEGSILVEHAKPRVHWRVGQEALRGISEPGLKQEAAKGGRWWEGDTKRGQARAVRGEAVGSGRLDSCHTEMASGLTASCVRCLRGAAAVLWKSTACLQHWS